MINDNEIEVKNEKKITQLQHKQTKASTWTQIYLTENMSQYNDGYILSNTHAMFQVQFMKILSNNEDEWKKSVAYKKRRVY